MNVAFSPIFDIVINKCVMTYLMMPAPAAATMTTMTNTAPIAVTQPGVGKPDVAKIGFITNNRQGKTNFRFTFFRLQVVRYGYYLVLF